jgi:hypothetical protein
MTRWEALLQNLDFLRLADPLRICFGLPYRLISWVRLVLFGNASRKRATDSTNH